MRQQSFGECDFARTADVFNRGADAERRQRLAIFLERDLGLVAEAHQRLFASELGAAPRPQRNLVGHHRPRTGVAGVFAERAVGASVAAEIGDGQKNLARVGNVAALAAIAKFGGSGEHRVEIAVGTFDERDRVRIAETRASQRPVEDLANRRAFALLRSER